MTPKPKYHGQDITKLGSELQQYHAVSYEIAMLGEVLRVANTLPPGTSAHAMTESFVMHVRTLASFLWDRRTDRTRSTDALAVDFVIGRAGSHPARLPPDGGPEPRARRRAARSTAMAMVGHKTEAIYRRYAIVDQAMLRDGSEKLARASVGTFSGTLAKARPGAVS